MGQRKEDQPPAISPAIKIELERLEGMTFEDALVNAEVDLVGIARPEGPLRLFDEVSILEISADGQHVVAVGRDDEKLTLIRDYEEVLLVEGGELKVVGQTDDFSRMLAIHEENGARPNSMYFIGESAEQIAVGSKIDLLACDSDLGQFVLILEIFEDPTILRAYNVVRGTPVHIQDIEVGRILKSVDILAVSDDLTKILWSESNSDQSGSSSAYVNGELLVEEATVIMKKTNRDGSRSMTFIKTEEEGRPKITVFVDTNKVLEDFEGGLVQVYADQDLTLAVCEIVIGRLDDGDKPKRQWLVMTPEGVSKTSVEFDDVAADEVTCEANRISAVVRIDGIKHKIVITREEPVPVKKLL